MKGKFVKPDGLVYRPDFITEAEEKQLLGYITRLNFGQVVIRDQPSRRLVRNFGRGYNFMTRQVTTGKYPIPDWLLWLVQRSEQFADMAPGSIIEALVTKYP